LTSLTSALAASYDRPVAFVAELIVDDTKNLLTYYLQGYGVHSCHSGGNYLAEH